MSVDTGPVPISGYRRVSPIGGTGILICSTPFSRLTLCGRIRNLPEIADATDGKAVVDLRALVPLDCRRDFRERQHQLEQPLAFLRQRTQLKLPQITQRVFAMGQDGIVEAADFI